MSGLKPRPSNCHTDFKALLISSLVMSEPRLRPLKWLPQGTEQN